MKLTTLLLGVFILISAWLALPARAQTTANFPSCDSPTGAIKASYSSGNHGILGTPGLFSGSDSVYSQGNSNYTQCFCPQNGVGVQTNWQKVGGLSEDQVSSLVAQGWKYVPDGAVWGLTSGPYLAINSQFACGNGSEVLGSQNLTPAPKNTIVSGVCGSCFWWPILLGEFAVLAGLFLISRKNMTRKRLVVALGVSVLAWIIWLILNRHNNCGEGVMNLLLFSLPCKLFWLLDGVVLLLVTVLLGRKALDK